jgi:transposase
MGIITHNYLNLLLYLPYEMPKFFDDDIREKLKELEEHIREEYLSSREIYQRDWRTYEQEFSRRMKEAIILLDPLIKESVESIHMYTGAGRPSSLKPEQKVKLLLIKQLVGESNRMFSGMLDLFSLLSGIDISYKTIERLYSDYTVNMALHNLHVLLLKKKNVERVDATGDGTGYSMIISKHYETYIQKLKDKGKENKGTNKKRARRRLFAFTFRIMDLKSKMYIAYGTSLKSEKDAFEKAMKMLTSLDTNIEIDSIRLDKYYSSPTYVDKFGAAKVYIIPKKNATLNGSIKWKNTMKEFVGNTLEYLGQYYLRNNSENGFSADKKMLGWSVMQKRDDRIDCAMKTICLWHNLFNFRRS